MLQLACDDLSLGLLPEAGGAIVWFAARGVDVLRRGDPAAIVSDPTAGACIPLVPYSGLIVDGRFRFGGTEHRLARNHPNEPDPIHGEGWLARWELVRQASAEVTQRYRHAPRGGAFPFAYLAEQHVAVDAGGLTVSLSVMSTGDVPMPAGIGLHPYFPDRSALVLELAASSMWARRPLETADAPVGPVPGDWRFVPARSAAGLIVDDSFVGWGGRPQLSWPERGVTVELGADAMFRFVQLHATTDDDFLCIEPVSNANDGFNLLAAGMPGQGVQILAPKKTAGGHHPAWVPRAG